MSYFYITKIILFYDTRKYFGIFFYYFLKIFIKKYYFRVVIQKICLHL